MYAPDARFEDAGLPTARRGDRAHVARAFSAAPASSRSTYTIAQAGPDRGSVEWTARYLFGGRRPVVNVILSELRFENGRIVGADGPVRLPPLGGPGARRRRGRWFGRFEWFRRAVAKKAMGRTS